MYCRFCGKEIADQSVYCQFCGKKLIYSEMNDCSGELPKRKEKGSKEYSIIVTSVFYVGIVTFLLMFMKMAPGVGTKQIVCYLFGASVAIGLAVLVNKVRTERFTYGREAMALAFGLLLLIPSITLRIIYEYKVDKAVADIPNSGIVYVDMSTDEEFFSYFKEGYVYDPSTSIRIDDVWYEGSAVFSIELGETYSMRVGSGYSGNHSFTDTTLQITSEMLEEGEYTLVEKVSLDNLEYVIVTITFMRVCTFWEVIFY